MKASPAGPRDELFGSGWESLTQCFINHNGELRLVKQATILFKGLLLSHAALLPMLQPSLAGLWAKSCPGASNAWDR